MEANNNIELIENEYVVTHECSNKNRCPDYDEDCVLVEDHLSCYLGFKCKNGTAKGYCPFIHTTN